MDRVSNTFYAITVISGEMIGKRSQSISEREAARTLMLYGRIGNPPLLRSFRFLFPAPLTWKG